MTNRVLRWLSAISLVMLALAVAWTLANMTRVVPYTTIVPYIPGLVLLPTTAVAVGEVAGVATLVVSLQRKQGSWVIGTLLCLILHFYGGAIITLPIGIDILTTFGTGAYPLNVLLYSFLALTPLVLVAFVYAWSRHRLSAIPSDTAYEADPHGNRSQ